MPIAIRTLFFVLLFTAPMAWANDASYYGEGASVFAYKENRIRMVSEHIRIDHIPEKDYPDQQWRAECTFVFENLDDREVTIQMGFPDQGTFPSDAWTIAAFRTWMDGESVPVTHKTIDPNHGRIWAERRAQRAGKEGELPLFPLDHDPDGWRAAAKAAMKTMNKRFGAAYTWSVTFAPGERKTIHNTYRFGGLSSVGPLPACLSEEDRLPDGGSFWHDSHAKFALGNGVCSRLMYVVTTGRSWHGSIGESVIEFRIPRNRALNHLIPLPRASEVTDEWVRWRFTNFEPTEEIRLIFATTFDEDEEHGTHGAIDFESPDEARQWVQFGAENGFTSEAFATALHQQRSSFGIVEDGKALPTLFGEFHQPKYSKRRSKNQLSKTEQMILEILEEAVRRAPSASTQKDPREAGKNLLEGRVNPFDWIRFTFPHTSRHRSPQSL